jgi:hypothetical protein
LPQGLLIQVTVSDNGVTYPPVTTIVPLLSSTTFNQLLTLAMPKGVPEAPTNNGPWARMGSNNTWVPTVHAPAQTSGNLAYQAQTQSWVVVYLPATTLPPANVVSAWNASTSLWEQIYAPSFTDPPIAYSTNDTAPYSDRVYAWSVTAQRWVNIYPQAFSQALTSGVSAWSASSQAYIQIFQPAYTQPIPDPLGVLWNPTVAPGASTGSWIPGQPRIGITDGTQAAVGQIGELIQPATPSPVNVALGPQGSAQMTVVSSAVLSPGDWQIDGQINWNAGTIQPASTAPYVVLSSFLSTSPAAPTLGSSAVLAVPLGDLPIVSLALGSQALNLTTATVLYLIANSWTTVAGDVGKVAQATGFISCRRVR